MKCWSPYLRKDLGALEMVAREVARTFRGMEQLPCEKWQGWDLGAGSKIGLLCGVALTGLSWGP